MEISHEKLSTPRRSSNTNKITAIRLANLIEQRDHALDSLIDYKNLKVHPSTAGNDLVYKKNIFPDLFQGAKMKLIHIVEENSKVIVHFMGLKNDKATMYFHIYRFNDNGLLTEAWMDSHAIS